MHADLAYFWRSYLIFPTKKFLKPRIKNKNQTQIGYPAITINFFPYPVCSLIKNPSAKLFKSTAIPSWLAPYLIICLARVSSSGFLRLVTLGKQNPWNPEVSICECQQDQKYVQSIKALACLEEAANLTIEAEISKDLGRLSLLKDVFGCFYWVLEKTRKWVLFPRRNLENGQNNKGKHKLGGA